MHTAINTALLEIKKTKPLVLHLTNYVSINFVANGLLALGASPIMSFAMQETEALLTIANALVINLGTLNENFIEHCHQACQLANKHQVPIILDPVGAGATQYRTQTALDLIHHYQIAIIRGNASEIMALAGNAFNTKGVDASAETTSSIQSAKQLAKNSGATVIVSGKIDVVSNDKAYQSFAYGDALMPTVTGTGCLLTAVVAAFHAVQKNSVLASELAVVFYSKCGELAAVHAKGPGSFKVNFLDALNKMLPEKEVHDGN